MKFSAAKSFDLLPETSRRCPGRCGRARLAGGGGGYRFDSRPPMQSSLWRPGQELRAVKVGDNTPAAPPPTLIRRLHARAGMPIC